MAEIIKPAAFNHAVPTARFVIAIDPNGNPVERLLPEMTADEVLAASEWLMDEFDRLDRLAACEGAGLSLVDWLKIDHPRQAAAEEVMLQHLYLMNLLFVAMPQMRHRRVTGTHDLRDVLRRYWPHGRAA